MLSALSRIGPIIHRLKKFDCCENSSRASHCYSVSKAMENKLAGRIKTSENGLKLLSLYRDFEPSVANSFFKETDQGRLIWCRPTEKGAFLDFTSMSRSKEMLIAEARA